MSEKRPNLKRLAYMLAVYSNSTIPQTYMNEMSNYELLLTLFEKVNSIIERTNTVTDAVNEILDLLSDIDDTIIEDVNRIVNEMYENGDFDDILERVTADYINKYPTNSELDAKRIFRSLHNIGDNYAFLETATPRPSKLASGTYINNYLGQSFIVECLSISGIYSSGDRNAGAIVMYNASDGSVAGQIWVNMEHMNSIDFNPIDENFYVAGCLKYLDGNISQESSLIYRFHISEIINRNTSITDLLALNPEQQSGAYQPTVYTRDLKLAEGGNSNIVYGNNISYANNLPANQIYVGYGENSLEQMAIYDFAENKIIETLYSYELSTAIRALKTKTGYTSQEGKVNGDYLYMITWNPSALVRINIKTQTIEHVYNLPQLLDRKKYLVGEYESVKVFDNGDCYFFSTTDINQGNRRQFRMAQCFSTNLKTGDIMSSDSGNRYIQTIIVDNQTNDKNPDGTSAHPFKRIFEACLFASTAQTKSGFLIDMKRGDTFYAELNCSDRCIFLAGVSGDNKCEVGGIFVIGGYCCIRNIATRYSLSRTQNPTSAYVNIYRANVNFDNVRIIANNVENVTTALRSEYSIMDWSGAGDFTVESGKQTESNGTPWTAGTFIYDTGSLINSHGWATLTRGILG